MSCRNYEKYSVCFTSNDGVVRQTLYQHTTYENGGPIATFYTDTALNVIDINTYSGGGTISIGQCAARNVLRVSEICAEVAGIATSLIVMNTYEGDNYIETNYINEIGVPFTGTIDALLDEVECCCDACFTTSTGDTPCAILRLDADPTSLSQPTLENYTLEMTSVDYPSCNVTAPFTGQTLTIVNVNGTLTVANFADMINQNLSAYGFRSVSCDQEPLGGTSGPAQGVAIVGPAGAGDWTIIFKSNGTGDDFSLNWDDTLQMFYTIEYVNGTPILDPGQGYHPSGGWLVATCTSCAP